MTTRRVAAWLYGVSAIAYAIDRVTKVWAESYLADGSPVRVVPGILDLDYTTNSGGAFGLGQSAPWLFAAASLTVALAIVIASVRLSHVVTAVALGLVLGGALGNLTDRAVRSTDGFLTGRVVDFIDFHFWPIFNLADTSIVLGALLLATVAARRDPEEP